MKLQDIGVKSIEAPPLTQLQRALLASGVPILDDHKAEEYKAEKLAKAIRREELRTILRWRGLALLCGLLGGVIACLGPGLLVGCPSALILVPAALATCFFKAMYSYLSRITSHRSELGWWRHPVRLGPWGRLDGDCVVWAGQGAIVVPPELELRMERITSIDGNCCFAADVLEDDPFLWAVSADRSEQYLIGVWDEEFVG